MTDPGRRLEAALVAAALAVLSGGPLAAQEAGSTAERTRRAFSFDLDAPTAAGTEQRAQAEAVAEAAAERLEVALLRTRVLEVGGRSVIAARVMEPGRDANTAFLVQTLILDPESGEVLGVFSGTNAEIGALPDAESLPPAPASEPETTAE